MPTRPQSLSKTNDNHRRPISTTNTPHPTQHGSLLSLPSESLTHLTSTLDPKSFFALSLVNHALYEHVSLDHSWHVAFNTQFLGLSPEADIGDPAGNVILLRRTESTWRKEFVKRWNVTIRFAKSRNPTISHTPHHSVVSSMILLPDKASLLCSSLSYGVVSRSFPFTGKILKGYLDAQGALNGQGIGNPNAEFSPDVTAISLYSPGGGTAKVAWGFLNGSVACTTGPKVMELGKSAKFLRCRPALGHEGLVTKIVWGDGPGNTFASSCSRGSVKLWETRRVRCVWTGTAVVDDTFPLLRSSIQELTYDSSSGTIIAATESGYIFVWSGIDVHSVTDPDRPPNDEVAQLVPRYFVRIAPLVESPVKPSSLVLQSPGTSPAQLHFAIFHENEPRFHKVSVDLKEPVPQFHVVQFCDTPLGVLKSFKADLLPVSSPATNPSIHPGTIPLSSAEIDVSLLSRNEPRLSTRLHSYVLAGDISGRICVWSWDSDPDDTDTYVKYPKVSSSQRWQAHDDGAVTAIEVDGAILATGSEYGTINVWDVLTLVRLRTFAPSSSRPGPDGLWERVSQIIVRGDVLIASIGSRVLAWKATPVGKDSGKSKAKGKKKFTVNPTAKWQQDLELKRDIIESRTEIEAKRSFHRVAYGPERDQLTSLSQLGLDEIEALEYVLMLSRDEEEARVRRHAESQLPLNNGAEELLFDMNEDIAFNPDGPSSPTSSLDSLGDQSSPFTRPPASFSATPIPSPRLSPRLSPSMSTSTTAISSKSMSASGSFKLKVSPRVRPEPMEAGPSMSPLNLSSLSGLSTEIRRSSVWHTPSSDAHPPTSNGSQCTSVAMASRMTDINNTTSISPPNASSLCIGSVSPMPTKRAWNAVVRAPLSPSSAPALAPPVLAASSLTARNPASGSYRDDAGEGIGRGGGPSLLTTSLTQNVTPPSPKTSVATTAVMSTHVPTVMAPMSREAEEAELRYVLDLSLAEAQSAGSVL